MRRLGRLVVAVALLGGALIAVSGASLAAGAPAASAASASAAGGTGCTGYNVGGNAWAVQCNNGAGYSTGSGGGSSPDDCTWITLAEAESQFLVSAAVVAEYKAPPGYVYLVQDCPDQWFGVQILLFANGGTLTTLDLAEQAYARLSPPKLAVGTAPPAGQDGLVGLPEWFWIDAADYLTLSRTVSLAGLSATVTAKPGPLVINPGDYQASFTCPGPGTQYNPAESAASQQSDCTFLYTQPSVGQPGNEFTVTVSVTWTATWTGTGGTGGTLAPITRTTTIELPIAQAETVFSGE
jgi:hypothetical protein